MNPDVINLSAYKYAESKLDDILSICNPLFRLNIKIFAYFRFFPEDADDDLGCRDQNSSFRLAMKKRIEKLNQEKSDRINKKKQEIQDREIERRHAQILWVAILGIAITIIIALITWFYFTKL